MFCFHFCVSCKGTTSCSHFCPLQRGVNSLLLLMFLFDLHAFCCFHEYTCTVIDIVHVTYTSWTLQITFLNDGYFCKKCTLHASTLTYFLTCPFGQLTKKSTCPTQSFSCPKKIIKITKTRE